MTDNHYLIVYRPPRASFPDDATAAESAAVGEHFEYLKRLLAAGSLVMAGRTEDASMGLAVLRADSDAAAERVMADDPAVKAGVFAGELHRYRLALLAGDNPTAPEG